MSLSFCLSVEVFGVFEKMRESDDLERERDIR